MLSSATMRPATASLASCVLLAFGCVGAEPPAPARQATTEAPAPSTLADPADRAGATRAELEGQPAPAGTPVAAPLHELRVSWLDVDEAEDGRGALVATERGLAFDVDARHFSPGALDPVLLVGEIELRRYEYLPDDVLRFVLAVVDGAPSAAPVALRYGEEAGRTIQLAPTFEVPR